MASAEEMNVRHFEIEPGTTVEEHGHPREQTGFVDEGELTLRTDGDSSAIPGDQPHAAVFRGDEPIRGVDVFSSPRENPSRQN